MRIRKVIAACVMLCTYTVGIASTLIPHCHHDTRTEHSVGDPDEARHHHHEHHQHHENNESDHDHIAHANHLDTGVLDFIICLLSEAEHPVSDGHHHFHVASAHLQLSAKPLIKHKIPVVPISLCIVLKKGTMPVQVKSGVNSIFQIPPLVSSPHRGPPA